MAYLRDRQFREVLDTIPDGVLIERGDAIAYINPAFARFLGYPSTTELSCATIGEIAHPEDLERLRWFGRCRREGKPAPTRYTFRACGRGGRVITFDASISLSRLEGETCITTIVRELAEEKRCTVELPGLQSLSPREQEIVQHLLAGRRSKEIAEMLHMSEKTVFTHRSRAFRKLALRGDRDLFRLAAESGVMGTIPTGA
jgi:PAS domain S-box-containing protein